MGWLTDVGAGAGASVGGTAGAAIAGNFGAAVLGPVGMTIGASIARNFDPSENIAPVVQMAFEAIDARGPAGTDRPALQEVTTMQETPWPPSSGAPAPALQMSRFGTVQQAPQSFDTAPPVREYQRAPEPQQPAPQPQPQPEQSGGSMVRTARKKGYPKPKRRLWWVAPAMFGVGCAATATYLWVEKG